MGIIELINTIVLVVGIGMMLTVFSVTFVKAIGEERRKTEELVAKLMDNWTDKTAKTVVDTIKELYEVDRKNKLEKAATYNENVQN